MWETFLIAVSLPTQEILFDQTKNLSQNLSFEPKRVAEIHFASVDLALLHKKGFL